MSKEHPTRRDLMKPVQLLGLALIAALFAGVVTLISMGFFQQRFESQSWHALVVALVVAGITFIVTVVVISLLLLAVDPAQITHEVDRPVLLPPGEGAPAQPASPAQRPAGPSSIAEPAPEQPAAEPDATASEDAGPDQPHS
jgi:hypothetical protein